MCNLCVRNVCDDAAPNPPMQRDLNLGQTQSGTTCPGCGHPNGCKVAVGEVGCWCGAKTLPASDDGVACLCASCLAGEAGAQMFDSDGALSREYLLRRGSCCGNRCRNCPFSWEAVSVDVL